MPNIFLFHKEIVHYYYHRFLKNCIAKQYNYKLSLLKCIIKKYILKRFYNRYINSFNTKKNCKCNSLYGNYI